MDKRRMTRLVAAGATAPLLIGGQAASAQVPAPTVAAADPGLQQALEHEQELPRQFEIPFGSFTFAPADAGAVLPAGGPRERQAPLVIWSDGAAVGSIDLPTPATRLRVRARADACEGPARMQVEVDGNVVLDTEVTTSWDNSTFVAGGSFAAGTHEVRVSFPNDLVTDDCDRNLKVGEVGFFADSTPRLNATPLRGTDFVIDPAGAGSTFRYGPGGEPGLVLWDNSSASATAATLGARMVVVRARADECEGAPQMQVLVNGRVVLDEPVRRQQDLEGDEVAGTYVGTGNWLGGTQDVEVRFVNDLITDDCDRNLKVESVTFLGTK